MGCGESRAKPVASPAPPTQTGTAARRCAVPAEVMAKARRAPKTGPPLGRDGAALTRRASVVGAPPPHEGRTMRRYLHHRPDPILLQSRSRSGVFGGSQWGSNVFASGVYEPAAGGHDDDGDAPAAAPDAPQPGGAEVAADTGPGGWVWFQDYLGESSVYVPPSDAEDDAHAEGLPEGKWERCDTTWYWGPDAGMYFHTGHGHFFCDGTDDAGGGEAAARCWYVPADERWLTEAEHAALVGTSSAT